jgi:predicted short-subunit dehydrogenase-like oxidoreductase (DUF2520 family)
MTPITRPTLGFIGAGKVGSVLARLLFQAGYSVCAVYSRTPAHANHLAASVQASVAAQLDTVVAQADLTLLTVPDDAIAPVAAQIKVENLVGRGVVHTSGAHDASDLEALARKGAMIGSLHPAFPFADTERAIDGLPGATFAIEAEDETLALWLNEIVVALSGQVLVIPAGGKATYHLALAIASGYTVTLYAIAEKLLKSLGADKDAADNALDRLLAGTLENLRSAGIPNALTGPLARGDVSTIESHLAVLRGQDKLLKTMYKNLARLSYAMMVARGISPTSIEQLLQQDDSHEINDT